MAKNSGDNMKGRVHGKHSKSSNTRSYNGLTGTILNHWEEVSQERLTEVFKGKIKTIRYKEGYINHIQQYEMNQFLHHIITSNEKWLFV